MPKLGLCRMVRVGGGVAGLRPCGVRNKLDCFILEVLWSRSFSEFELRCAYSSQLCALWFAADHGADRGGCVEPDRLDVPESGFLEPR